ALEQEAGADGGPEEVVAPSGRRVARGAEAKHRPGANPARARCSAPQPPNAYGAGGSRRPEPERRSPRRRGFLQRLRGLQSVGETGFEPATPWSRTGAGGLVTGFIQSHRVAKRRFC